MQLWDLQCVNKNVPKQVYVYEKIYHDMLWVVTMLYKCVFVFEDCD